MLGINVRKLFRKGKLYERECFGGYSIICYDQDGVVNIKRYFQRIEKDQLYDFIAETYRMYEYEGQQLSARQIAQLYGVDHTTIDKIIARAKQRVKEGIEEGIKHGYKKTTILKNIDILL